MGGPELLPNQLWVIVQGKRWLEHVERMEDKKTVSRKGKKEEVCKINGCRLWRRTEEMREVIEEEQQRINNEEEIFTKPSVLLAHSLLKLKVFIKIKFSANK